ncbi:hypothetical protein R84B8_00096 [Treponema sp. R8-4-B8]
MKKASLTVFLGIAGIFIAISLTACEVSSDPFGWGTWLTYDVKITKMPNKLTYVAGEMFNASGLVAKETKRQSKTGEKREEKPVSYDEYPTWFDLGEYKYNQLSAGMENIYVMFNDHALKIPITVTRINEGDFDAWLRLPPYEDTLSINRYSGTGGIITIPSTINGRTVTAIERNVFKYKQITGVTIPDSITTIGEYAFKDNPLTSVTIGADVAHKDKNHININIDIFPENDSFWSRYDSSGGKAGTYIRASGGTGWTRQ